MFGRKKPLEERICTAIEAEFASLVAELERDLREYRRRSRAKAEARAALERVENEARRLHLERIALNKRFWEAYYGKGEAILSEIELEHRSLERAMNKAEKALKKARMHFEKVDFDEVKERTVLQKKAHAAEEKTDLRIEALEETIEELLAGIWRNVKELSGALRGEGGEPHSFGAREEETYHRRSA